MSLNLSLQGCMAVGKTTALKHLEHSSLDINISYEMTNNIITEINNRQLNKNRYEDYLEIQKLWIENEFKRFDDSQKYKYTLMDFGAEEIEFYTLNYPVSMGLNWSIEPVLHHELERLRQCFPKRILFLDASEKILRIHKENDKTRSRNFFDYYIKYLLPLKKNYFLRRSDTDILNIDDLSKKEVALKVEKCVQNCINTFN